MISALAWVPRGAAARHPQKFVLSDEAYEKIAADIGQEVSTVKQKLANVKQTTVEDELAEYQLDTYDDEEGLSGIPVFGSSKGLVYYEDASQDPYIQMKESDEEEQELEILDTDNLLIACKTEEEVSYVEIYVHEEDNLYVHHDIMLPSFPLCVEWMNFKPNSEKGNMMAIGTFEPEIEVWDLDVLDAVYPSLILGQNTKKKHSGAVTCLSWNKTQRNLLLSGSADHTVKLWDLERAKAVHHYPHHTDKVASVCWNEKEPTVFLTGGYDQGGRVCALDSRAPQQVASWLLRSDVECVAWDPFCTERFYVSTEDGLVRCFDARQVQQGPVYTLHAHDAAVSALDVSRTMQGLLVTGSADKYVKVWDIRHEKPTCLATKDLGVGKVFSAKFSMDDGLVLASAGSKGKMVLWNLRDNANVCQSFDTTASNGQEVVTMVSDGDESDHVDEIDEMEE